MSFPIYLSAMGMVSALGSSHAHTLQQLLAGSRDGMVKNSELIPGKELRLGTVSEPLPECQSDNPSEHSRNNQLILAALEPITEEVNRLVSRYGAHRIGVVVGTSTSGTLEAEGSMDKKLGSGQFPQGYDFSIQEMGDLSRFLANTLELTGPAYTVSTACSSSGKVFAAGKRLLQADVCDAVVVGGADSLCRLTVNGFTALESVANGYCQPFSKGRDGINLGEGAALFTMTKETSEIQLMGVGESSDAWHISAPHPEGRGAINAMQSALDDAGLADTAIDYLNLHGTATPLNDAMESYAVNQVFSHPVPCSSTKTMTGHTLGAAGAIEAGFAWLLLTEHNQQQRLPPHIADNDRDSEIAPLNLVNPNHEVSQPLSYQPLNYIMSNSFAFGGSNVCLILGRSNTKL